MCRCGRISCPRRAALAQPRTTCPPSRENDQYPAKVMLIAALAAVWCSRERAYVLEKR
jgi:hypothetical protein